MTVNKSEKKKNIHAVSLRGHGSKIIAIDNFLYEKTPVYPMIQLDGIQNRIY